MKFYDKRLPKGITIWLNDWEEYVAIEFDKVAQFRNKGIRASKTLEGSIQNYLTKER